MLRSPLRDEDLLAKYEHVKEFIRSELKGSGAEGLVVALSGGLDSSMALKACVDSVGAGLVLGLLLPESGLTPEADMADATSLASALGVATEKIDIGPIVEAITKTLPEQRLAKGNLKARIRMALLYYFGNLQSRLVVGTGDRSEILLGYYTKYGDGGVDLLPLGGLYKTELRVLGRSLGLPASVVEKPSSPTLWAGQTAEGELGLSYEKAYKILVMLTEERLAPADAKARLSVDREVDVVARRIARTSHKREMPHICQ
jgi:NAD+ synthase